MRPIHKILVAVKDLTSRSLPAVKKAAQLARACNAKLEIFHGITTPLYMDAYGYGLQNLKRDQTGIRARCLLRLEVIAARIRPQGVAVTVSAVWDFPAYEAIVRRAQQVKADLIVSELHAGRHLAPRLLQLTDWELLRVSPVPVLLVKTSRPYRRPIVLAAVDPSHAFAKPAKLDQEILNAGAAVAHALHGTLHAMHAYVPVPIDALAAGPVGTYPLSSPAVYAERAAAAATAGFEHALRSSRIARTRRHLVCRYPRDAIREIARDIGSAIVVMGGISRSGIKRLFIGNTAESLLDQLRCDLLIVRPPRHATHVSRAVQGPRFISVGPPALPLLV